MTGKNRAIEFYRFAAAILILCYHFHWAAFPDGELFAGCYLFVEFFFILSGYLMFSYVRRHGTEAERREPAKAAFRYMRERLRRLYPQHLLSWALVAAIGLFELKKDGKSSYVRALPKKNHAAAMPTAPIAAAPQKQLRHA